MPVLPWHAHYIFLQGFEIHGNQASLSYPALRSLPLLCKQRRLRASSPNDVHLPPQLVQQYRNIELGMQRTGNLLRFQVSTIIVGPQTPYWQPCRAFGSMALAEVLVLLQAVGILPANGLR